MSNDMLITEIFKMVRQMIEGYYNRGLPSGMLMSHLNLLEGQIKEDFVEVEKPVEHPTITGLSMSPFYRDSVGTEELHEKER